MTPEEARDLLKNTTPGDEWYYRVRWGAVQYIEPVTVIPGGDVDVTEDDAALIVAAPEMAAMIAGMREEWGIVTTYLGRHEVEEWGFSTREEAEAEGESLDAEFRIVRRHVTTPEEA